MRSLHTPTVFAVAIVLFAASVRTAIGDRQAAGIADQAADISQLWQEPADLESRDLFAGPGGTTLMPDAAMPFTFVKADRSGYSRGYDVTDANGLSWSVKLGPEAQTEVASSRILWAIGYHQVPTYYLSTWSMTGGPPGHPGGGRFRPDLPDRKVVADWSWSENPFVNTQPLRGLLVANLILNNWDWKTSNNKVYEINTGDGAIARQYVVRDLGASLGKTSSPKVLRLFGWRGAQGSRNDVDGFEQQGFITAVNGKEIEFDYKGIYGSLVKMVTPADVVWTSELLARLSDEQWNDAFRAAGYPPDQAARFIAKLKSKIAEGLALATTPDASAAPAAVIE